MGNFTGELVICILILLSVSTIYGINQLVKSSFQSSNALSEILGSTKNEYAWMLRLCLNSLGYATILLPGYLIYNYVRCSKYLQRSDDPGKFKYKIPMFAKILITWRKNLYEDWISQMYGIQITHSRNSVQVGKYGSAFGKGFMHNIIHTCLVGHGESSLLDSPSYVPPSTSHVQRTFSQEALLLIYCFLGLQFSYLTWGYLQEKIMTQEYVDAQGNTGHFRDSQFLVFVNRILAFFMSGLYLIFKRQPRHTTPLFKYTFCSLSNIMSSWCQYEALMYVSFPTQVLAKACKIIPVMIMGKIISRSKYEYYEYVTALLISIGMTFFLLGSSDDHVGGATTASGIFLLAGYMMLDSFTSNWQNALFKEYSVTSVQMMCGVNMFSCLLTAMSLFQQSSFTISLAFMAKYPSFIIDCMLISICSATGQLYIFYTISTFGAVTFVIIMTIRQGLAILLSCLMYHHKITILGVFGIILVFGAVFLRIYCSHRIRAIKRRKLQAASIKI